MAAEVRVIIDGEGNVIQFLGDVRKGVGGVGEEAEKQNAPAKGFFSSITEIAGGIIASNVLTNVGSQLSGMFTGGIADAREAAGIMAQTQSVIKSTGAAAGFTAEQIGDMAGALSAAEGKSLFGDSDIQKGQNLLLTFTNIKETLPEATGVMVDMAQALGTDVAGGAIQLGKALNDPIAGISALSRVGVTFTEEQKAQIKAMQDAGDTAGAQRVILAELNKEFGGSALAAAQADGGIAQFKDRLGEAGETIGAAFLPALGQIGVLINSPAVMGAIEAFATLIATGLGAAFEWLSTTGIPGLIAAWAMIQPAVSATLGVLQMVGDFISANLQPVLYGLAAAFLTVVVPAFIAWATAAGAAAIATITALAPVIIPIVAIGAAVALLKAAWDSDFGGIRSTLTAFWESTGRPIFEQIKTWLSATLTAAVKGLAVVWETVLLPAIRAIAQFWTSTLQPALAVFASFLSSTVIPVIVALANVHFAALKLAAQGIATFWTSTLQPALSAVASFLSTTATSAVAGFNLVLGGLKQAFDFVVGAVNAVYGAIQALVDFWNSIKPPDWITGHSPPPLANWFSDVAASVRDTTNALPALDTQMQAMPVGPIGSGAPAAAAIAGGSQTVRIILDDRGNELLRKLINVQIDERIGQAGAKSLSRQRMGG